MFCYFAPVTRHSFQAMCTLFSRKDFFRLFDGLLRISTRKTNAEPRCLTSLGGHDGAICAAKHLELVHVHHLANPYTDLTDSLRGTKYFRRETNSWFSRDVTKILKSKPGGLQKFYLHLRKDYLKIFSCTIFLSSISCILLKIEEFQFPNFHRA